MKTQVLLIISVVFPLVIFGQNTFYGEGAGQGGEANSFFGTKAGTINYKGAENVFVGFTSGYSNETGRANTFVGASSGYKNGGSGNVFIGYNAGYNEGKDNKLYIANSDTNSPLIYGDFREQFAAINGILGVGIANPSYKLHVFESSTSSTKPWALIEGGRSVFQNIALRLFDKGTANGNTNILDFAHANGSNPVSGAQIKSVNVGANTGKGANLILEAAYNNSNGLNKNQLFLKNNGNIGIGTATPGTKLHINNGISGGSPHAFSDFVIEDNDHVMVNLLAPSNKIAYYGFSNNKDDYVGGIQYNNNSNKMTFRVNNHSSDMIIQSDGNVGIGTTTPDEKLAVNGKIHSKEVRVDLNGWPDYVFAKSYKLPTLMEVESYIKQEGHLQNIPSASEVEEKGIHLGEMNAKLLEKIEELTLYTIQQQKEIDTQKQKNKDLENRIKNIESKLKK